MNHYETVFILTVLSDVQVKETVSKFEDFLTTREPQWFRRGLGPKKKWLTKFKTKKVVSIFEFNVQEKF
jgi:small subunit ribosomal protein S6